MDFLWRSAQAISLKFKPWINYEFDRIIVSYRKIFVAEKAKRKLNILDKHKAKSATISALQMKRDHLYCS